MSPAAAAYAAYKTAGIDTLNQRDLIVRLYQGAERFLEASAVDMEAGRFDVSLIAARKAKHIFVELLSTLDCMRGGEVAQRLHALYAFFIGQIVEANLRQTPARLRDLLPLVADLRSAWQEIPDELANGAGALTPPQGNVVNRRI